MSATENQKGRGSPRSKVIDVLNQARTRELLAIGQYMAQHYELEDAGYGKLGDKIKEIAITEMRHAEALAERIVFLGGVPVTKPQGSPRTKEEIPALLRIDENLEAGAISQYNEAAAVCGQDGDNISRDLFVKLIGQEEEHLNEFQNTLDHVEKMGSAYLATLVE